MADREMRKLIEELGLLRPHMNKRGVLIPDEAFENDVPPCKDCEEATEAGADRP